MPTHFNKKKHKQIHPISDHAIVRFLERTKVVDIKYFRNRLMTSGLRRAISKSKSDEAKNCIVEHTENGIQFVIEDGRVVTIMTEDSVRCKDGSLVRFIPGTIIRARETKKN